MIKMNKLVSLTVVILFICLQAGAQVAINADGSSPDASAILDVKSTEKGFLPPRMTKSQRDAIVSPVPGLLIYQTNETPGYYYYTGTHWIGIIGTGTGAISTSSLIDCDGNNYPIMAIGNQVWMATNLHVTHYRNGDAILNETNDATWASLTSGAYCWYNNNQNFEDTYGAIYNWYAITDARGICPDGWHVPSSSEWTTLTTYLGGISVAGGKMKATINLWSSPNTNATNSSYFSGLPGGCRDNTGLYKNISTNGYWWSSTESSSSNAWFRVLNYNNASVTESNSLKQNGFSVRCLRD